MDRYRLAQYFGPPRCADCLERQLGKLGPFRPHTLPDMYVDSNEFLCRAIVDRLLDGGTLVEVAASEVTPRIGWRQCFFNFTPRGGLSDDPLRNATFPAGDKLRYGNSIQLPYDFDHEWYDAEIARVVGATVGAIADGSPRAESVSADIGMTEVQLSEDTAECRYVATFSIYYRIK